MNRKRPPVYERIGADYNRHRAAEPTVVYELVRLLRLSQGSTIVDVGAGTGNYSNAIARLGYRVEAVEPSALMRSQARQLPNVSWHAGTAEALPFRDDTADGIICTLAVHHFADLDKAASEMRRVCRNGPIVVLTIDPRLGDPFWLSDYFPAIHDKLFSTFPPLQAVCDSFVKEHGGTVEVVRYLLPRDTLDMTMHSGWNKPEIYLDQGHRRNMSGFALASPKDVAPGLAALRADLASGNWDRRHGHLRGQTAADLGFRFVRTMP